MVVKKSKECVGIAIGQRNIAAVRISQNSSLHILDSILEENAADLFNSEDYTSLGRCLNSVLNTVASWIGNRYVPVRVALPDPSILTHAICFDDFPKERKRQQQLVSWQMEKTFHVQHDALSVSYLKERENGTGTRVFITAINKSLLQAINSAFSSVKVEPEAVMMATLYCLSTKNNSSSTDMSAHIRLNKEYFSIVVLNSRGQPYLSRSIWRESENLDSKDEILEIIKDVKLTLHAFVMTNKGKRLDKIILHVEDEDERDIFQHHFINQESISLIDDYIIDRRIYSSYEDDYLRYTSALEAATV